MDIVFRRIKKSDLETIRHWRMLPEVTKYMYTDPHITWRSQKRWYEQISTDPTCAHWIIQVDSINVGLVYFTNIDMINGRANWAYYIAEPSYKGKGLGTQLELNILHYVFHVLNLNKLCCEVFSWNERVISIHEHFGSKIEGSRRQHIYKNDQFHDIVEMAILKEEWEQIKGNYTRIPAVFKE